MDLNPPTGRKIADKIEQWNECIDAVIKDVISLEETTTAPIHQDHDEMPLLIKTWTKELQTRYKVIVEIEVVDDVEFLVLDVIKHCSQNNETINICEQVNGNLQEKFEYLDTAVCQKNILLNILVSNSELAHLTEINDITALRNSLVGDELIQYKIREFEILKSLIYGKQEEIFDNDSKTVEDTSKKLNSLSKSKHTDEHKKLEEEYGQLCEQKVKNIIDSLALVENSFGVNFKHLRSVLLGQERLYSNNFHRHEFYDKISAQLELSSTYSCSNEEMEKSKFIKELKNIQEKMIADQLEEFLLKCTTEETNTIKNPDEKILEIVATYCSTGDNNFNADELQYQLNNVIELGKLTSNKLYTVAKTLSDVKNENMRQMKWFLVAKADRLELKKIKEQFMQFHLCQKEQYKKVAEAKTTIADEYGTYCGIMDRSVRDNYVDTIRLYLDMLDWLVGHKNDDTISKREETLTKLQIHVKKIIENTGIQAGDKADLIESAIAEELSKVVFSNCKDLKADMLDHFETFSTADTVTEYKRKDTTSDTVPLQDLISNNGRFKVKERRELFLQNKTVIANVGNTTYYRLADDIQSLKQIPDAYKKSVVEFENLLSSVFKEYKLSQLKISIKAYDENKNVKNLIELTKDLVYFLSLDKEFLDTKLSFEEAVESFLKTYNETIKNLMIDKKIYQDIITELMDVIDTFSEDVVQQKIDKCKAEKDEEKEKLNNSLVLTLKSLRSTLSYKTYKESGFKLFTEEQHQFSQMLASKIPKRDRLMKIIQKDVPEIIWLRSLFPVMCPEEFFASFQQSIDHLIPNKEIMPSDINIEKLEQIITSNKNQIVFSGLLDEGSNVTTDNWTDKLRSGGLSWNRILNNIETQSQLWKKLRFIIQEYSTSFTNDHLEELFLVLASKTGSHLELESFLIYVLRLYGKSLVEKKNSILTKAIADDQNEQQLQHLTTSVEMLEAVITNAIRVYEIDQNSCKKKTGHEFVDHLKTLEAHIPDQYSEGVRFDEIINSLEKIEMQFIVDILNTKNVADFQLTNVLSSNEDLVKILPLVLELPNSFFNDQTIYLEFMESLIKNISGEHRDQEYFDYIRNIIYRYFNLFLDTLICAKESPSKQLLEKFGQWKADIMEVMDRLYGNVSSKVFIRYAEKWIGIKNGWVKDNFVIQSLVDENTTKVGLILSNEEIQHLHALLRFEIKNDSLGFSTNNVELVMMTLNEKKFETRSTIKVLRKMFTATFQYPIATWKDNLIELRTNTAVNGILNKFSDSDGGTTKLTDVVNAFVFFNEQTGTLMQALFTLDLIYENVCKFSTLEEVKQSIMAILKVTDLDAVNDIIKTSDKHQLKIDLIFFRINAGNNKKLKTAIDKLKLILSYREFEKVNFFCRLFLIQAREQQHVENLLTTIELILDSKAYNNSHLLKMLQDKDMSLWNRYLEKAIIHEKLNTKIFDGLSAKQKNKATELLYQIREEKGKFLQDIVLAKINGLQERPTFQNLNLILKKIIHKSYVLDALNDLSTDINDWNETLFPSNKVSSGNPLTIKQLLTLMQEGDKICLGGINECVKSCIQSDHSSESPIERVLNEARNLEKHSKFFKNSKIIAEWQEEEITKWSKCFSKMSDHHNEVYYWNTTESTETICEVLSVIIRAVIIYDHHPNGPRDTQLMALLLFLDNGNKGRLGNIFTGEGKTLITVMLATCLGLMGKRVDVVTSSKLLAIRDSKERPPASREGYAGFYEMFGCKSSNNCDEECEKSDTGESERKGRYSRCNIMYGETGYFQRDILLTQFFRKDIRRGGNSIGDVLILDEVDSMMIDNAAKTLYISHNLTDVRYVKDIFLHIWAAVNSKEERHYSEKNVAKIVDYINKITANDESGDLHVSIPNTLKPFVQFNLKTWIDCAYNAKYIKENDAYIIGDEESKLKNEIIIMDKDTGVEQRSTKWSNGQHQFIQLKHSGKLSDESLKAVFISNSGYFQMYAKLYGMTGTVGEDEERKLLNQIYGIDFFEMPRFKEYRFEYDFESECIAQTKEEWLQNIVDNVEDTMNQSFKYSDEFNNSMKEKFDKEQQCFQKLDSQSKTLGKELKRLEKQRAECEQLVEIYESIHRLSRAIISLCAKASVDTFMAEIQSIGSQINSLQSLKDVDAAKDVEALQYAYRMLPKIISEYSIEQFGRTFMEKINTSEMASLGNRKTMQLETLISLIKKEQTKFDFVNETKAKSYQDMAFYGRESKCTAQSAKRNCKRAVLIICDNIADLNIIEAELRRKFKNPKADPTDEYKIYKYDRAYKRFDVSCLEMGDIVVATNIAGRGTDLEVSKEVEENGGLHVILSYIPKNFRIEKQAFGRTSRAGNKGSGTYIVLDDRKEFEDIAQLQKERNEEESRRLGLVLNEQLPKINLEDELFKQFNVLQHSIEIKVQDKYKTFKRKKEYRSKSPTELQLDSLKNKWALWLNLISDKIGKVNMTGEKQILSEYKAFESEIYKNVGNKYGLIDEPGELTKLGRCLLDNEQYSEALNIFDYIVKNHASFSGTAEYYKTFCVIHLDGGGHDAKVKAKAALKRSLSLLEADRTRILSRNQILKSINDLTRIGGKGMDSNLFAKQNEGEAQILSIHINAINSAIGYEVTPDCFNGVGIVGDQSQKIFDTLLNENYDILKNYRISKKIFVGCKVLITDREKQNIALTGKFKDLDEWLKNSLGEDFIIFNDISSFQQYENYKKSLETLQKANVISTAEIFKRLTNNGISVSNSKNIIFPDSFAYCKDKVLDDLVRSMIDSRNECGWYKKREKKSTSFESMIYTKEKFLHEAEKIIRTENLFQISSNIKDKLLGKLDHPVYCGNGNQIKKILTSELLRLDHKFLEEKLNKIQNDDERFFGKLATIKQYLLGVGGESGNIETLQFFNGAAFGIKDDIIDYLEKIVTITTDRSLKDEPNFKELLCYLNLNITSSVIPADQLNELIIKKTSLNGSQVKEILSHLQFYIQLHVDHNFLEQKFKSVKNEIIFLGKKSEIKEFCLGKTQVDIGGGKILRLIDNHSVGKCDIVRALKLITKISDDSSASNKSNFEALQIHLGLDAGTQLEAVRSYKQYVFQCESYNDKIKTYLQTFNLKDILKSDEIYGKIDRLNLSVDSRLQKSSAEILNVLKDNLQIDLQLNKENFKLDEDAFEILAAILTDANIISRSLFALLNGNEGNAVVNSEMETILMRMFHAKGVIVESDIILKDAKQGSKELFSRLLDLHIIKLPKVNFPLGRAKYIGGNNWEESSDPVKKLEHIKAKVEKVVMEVFKLERKDDLGHTINEYITGGIGTESKNKDLDEKIETITNAIKSVAGVIKTVPQVKIETKDLRSMFGSGRVPPELMDYIHMSFDAVLEYKEHHGFDWDCFLCAMIGVAQIVAGVAIEILSGGTAHFIAQALISEGIGDIVFAIQAGIEGNFSWKSYRKHKVQSIMLTIVTGGVGAYLSKGAEAGKIAVGLATKTALFKAVAKTALVEMCTAVSMSIVNVGSEEISKVIVEEISNVHFVQYFEKFIKEDSAYLNKTTVFERRLNNFYEKYGTTAVRQSVDACLESCLNQMACGALGNQIFNKVSSLMGSVTRACSNAANRFQKGSSKAKVLGTIAKFIEKTFQLAEYTKNFGQLCTLCNDFYDLAIKELDALERSLVDQQKNGTLNIGTEQIAQDKVQRSFSEEAKSVSKEAEKKMHTAFMLKIKNGFVQPAVSSMLHMAVKPIQQLITAPFSNAMEQLAAHVDMRAELKLKDIMEQNPDRISRLTSRQKKALELRGEIFLAEDIDNSDILKANVANFPGETIESLRKEHGPNVGIVIKDNEIYVVLPTFNQFTDNIINGKVNVVGGLQRKIAANLAGKGIDVVNENIDGSESFEHHEKEPETIKPMGGVQNGENYKIAFIEGGEGKVGHYAPVIKDKDGKWKVIRDLAQEKDTKDACFGQCMIFLKEFEKKGEIEARSCAENSVNVTNYYKELGKYAKHNDAFKQLYLKGLTVKSNRLVGGDAGFYRNSKLENLFNTNSDSVQTKVIKRVNVSNDDDKENNLGAIEEQLAYVPFMSPEGQNENITCMDDARKAAQLENENRIVRLHIINARVGGPADETNLFLGTASMNRMHYTRFETHMLEFLRLNAHESGGLFIKTKIGYQTNLKVAHTLDISVGTNNPALQRKLDDFFKSKEGFQPDIRKGGRIDYKLTLTTSEQGRRKTIPKHCDTEWEPSSEYDNAH